MTYSGSVGLGRRLKCDIISLDPIARVHDGMMSERQTDGCGPGSQAQRNYSTSKLVGVGLAARPRGTQAQVKHSYSVKVIRKSKPENSLLSSKTESKL